jgi:hypothetical protein
MKTTHNSQAAFQIRGDLTVIVAAADIVAVVVG